MRLLRLYQTGRGAHWVLELALALVGGVRAPRRRGYRRRAVGRPETRTARAGCCPGRGITARYGTPPGIVPGADREKPRLVGKAGPAHGLAVSHNVSLCRRLGGRPADRREPRAEARACRAEPVRAARRSPGIEGRWNGARSRRDLVLVWRRLGGCSGSG